MSEHETAGFLATVPLLQGSGEADLLGIARVLRRRTVERVMSSGARATWRGSWSSSSRDGVSASLQVPGDRVVEIGRAGPGEIVGEIGLLEAESTR